MSAPPAPRGDLSRRGCRCRGTNDAIVAAYCRWMGPRASPRWRSHCAAHQVRCSGRGYRAPPHSSRFLLQQVCPESARGDRGRGAWSVLRCGHFCGKIVRPPPCSRQVDPMMGRVAGQGLPSARLACGIGQCALRPASRLRGLDAGRAPRPLRRFQEAEPCALCAQIGRARSSPPCIPRRVDCRALARAGGRAGGRWQSVGFVCCIAAPAPFCVGRGGRRGMRGRPGRSPCGDGAPCLPVGGLRGHLKPLA